MYEGVPFAVALAATGADGSAGTGSGFFVRSWATTGAVSDNGTETTLVEIVVASNAGAVHCLSGDSRWANPSRHAEEIAVSPDVGPEASSGVRFGAAALALGSRTSRTSPTPTAALSSWLVAE
jgi:hypothetical protein